MVECCKSKQCSQKYIQIMKTDAERLKGIHTDK